MKKIIIILLTFMTLGAVQSVQAQTSGDDPVYIETISNPTKTIDLILALYPKTYKWSESLEASQLTLRVLNQSKQDFDWTNYKVYILFKDNTLLYNYTTKASSGEFNCTYSVDRNSTIHDQTVCFDKKFDIKDIKSVWVSFDSSQFFELFFYQK